MAKQHYPNLFRYATKELSQDAMICWLIKWADDQYATSREHRGLHDLGRRFVTALLHQHEAAAPTRIEAKIHQQDNGIDVLARIGREHVLLIEDKTGTSDHGGQLKRYYDHVVGGRTKLKSVANECLYPIYLKTGNQPLSKDQRIERATDGLHRPYKVFNRQEFLEVLDTYRGEHPIVRDYRAHLRGKECRTNAWTAWKEEDRENWSRESWEGLYMELEKQTSLRPKGWRTVSNPAGGFLAFLWNWINLDEADSKKASVTLCLEVNIKHRDRQKLCFKLIDVDKPHRSQLKEQWKRRVLDAGEGKAVRPRVLRAGNTMTVGHWEGDWIAFSNGSFDFNATVVNLKKAGRILDRAARLRN